MRLKEYEVVIEPREVKFEHVEANKLFRKTIHIKNVGNKSKRMELFRPSNKVFKLEYKNPEQPVPPGMEIMAVVNFETNVAQDYSDKMVVSIDDRELEIPIVVYPAKPILEIDEMVDFGTRSASNKTISAKLKVTNKGALAGAFIVSYKGQQPITFVPARDTIPADSVSYIRVDFFTKNAGKFEETAEICVSGTEQVLEFKIKANIMEKQLMLLEAESGVPISRVDFGSCYYGCNVTSVAMLYNHSPEKCDYVILLEEDGVGAEIGAELSKSSSALRALDNDYKEDDFSSLDKLVTAFPNNGTLEPFEKRPIFFRFSPRFSYPKLGFVSTLKPPPRRDYAVFLYVQQLGAHNRTELAITGSALPVLLRVEPAKIQFEACQIGEKRDMKAVLTNDSELKSLKFKFRKVANYTVSPACGRIPPRSSRDVLVSFVPNQIGNFDYKLYCEVTDKTVDERNPLVTFDYCIKELPIELSGSALAITVVPPAKFSGGMSPVLTNEVGLNVNTKLAEIQSFSPKAVVQNAAKDHLHKHASSNGRAAEYKAAFPNDRFRSVAPFNRTEKYKTIFTGIERYNYVDPDYAFTDDEIRKIEQHKRIYKEYIDNLRYLRQERNRNKDHSEFKDAANIGLRPGDGLKPQTLSLAEIDKEKTTSNFQTSSEWKLISTKELAEKERRLKSSKEAPGFDASGLSVKEKEKLSAPLNPAQIYKIGVSPALVDFGEIAVRSASVKNLEFTNSLDQPILVEIEAREL